MIKLIDRKATADTIRNTAKNIDNEIMIQTINAIADCVEQCEGDFPTLALKSTPEEETKLKEEMERILKENPSPVYIPITTPTFEFNSDPCTSCPNRPKDGETKVCHCTLPYLTNSGSSITYTTGTVITDGTSYD